MQPDPKQAGLSASTDSNFDYVAFVRPNIDLTELGEVADIV